MQDALLKFSDAQALTTTAVSTNVLDLLVARDIGVGDLVEINAYVGTALTGGTSLQIVLQASVDNSTYADVLLSPVVVTARLTAGAHLFQVPLPRLYQENIKTTAGMPRYLRLNYVIVGTFGAGTINSWLSGMFDRNAFYAYPRNYSV